MALAFPPRPRFQPSPKYGNLQLTTRYLLSPLAGYTNLPFRRIVRELGGLGLATTDLVNARGLLAGNRKSLQLVETCAEDSPLAVQIFGTDKAMLRAAAELLEARGVDSIDVNMGCPVERVTENGSGASMMCRPQETIASVQAVVEAVKIPVTVKMRLGWDSRQITAPRFAREFEQIGVAAVAVHGRTRAQGFRGSVDLTGVRRVVEAVCRIPVIGNGDVRTVEDAERMLRETGCQGVSIGRGALANPWIFRQLMQWERTGRCDHPGNFEDRLRLLLRQFELLESIRGTHDAIITFRKTGHWYLKAMRVPAWLRDRFQKTKTRQELDAVIQEILQQGPLRGTRTDRLYDFPVRVPSGPVERW